MNELNITLDQILIRDFDNKAFAGITSLTYNQVDNVIYFTDGGKLENNQVYPAVGSVFMIDLDSRVLKPILYECLSYPSDIIYDYLNKVIYVSETLGNRIVRIKANNAGIYHSSIFYQFNGRIGPRAMTIDENGNLYVSRFEYAESLSSTIEGIIPVVDGLISVLDASGNLRGEIIIPRSPEIISLFISSKKKDSLYFTLNENKTIFKIKLSAFTSELESLESNIKKAFIHSILP